MSVESADDLAGMFDVDDFGTSATFLPAGGGSSTVTGIFNLEYVEAGENDAGAAVATQMPTFMCPTTSVPNVAQDDGLTIGSTAYTIVDIEPSNDGAVTKLILGETI